MLCMHRLYALTFGRSSCGIALRACLLIGWSVVCAQCRSLTLLDVSSNRLRVVPPDVAKLARLTRLDLSLNPVLPEIDAAAKHGQSRLMDYLRTDAYDELFFTTINK